MENKEEHSVSKHTPIEDKVKKDGYKLIAGAILIVGILIAGAILLRGGTPAKNPNTPSLADIKLKPVANEEHILGNKDAKVVIVTYSDTECPFSKMFQTTMQKVLETKGNDIAWVYRHFPLDCADSTAPGCRTLHSLARGEAEATECAYEQGGNDIFWKYIEEIYKKTKSNDGLDQTEITKIANTLSLNMEQFNSCTKSRKYQAKVSADATGGASAGVTGTPKSFILKKGKVVDTIDGAMPYEAVMQKINAVLK